MDKNEFSDYYKSISNIELLQIIDNPKAYQPSALEAAKVELKSRNLSTGEQHELRNSNNELATKKIEQRDKIKKVEVIAKNKIFSVLEVINPIETGIPSTEKKIRFLTIVYTFMFIAGLVQSARLVLLYMDLFSIQAVITFSQFIVLPIALILFWKRRTEGWTLFTIYVIFTITISIVICILWSTALTSTILLQGAFLVATQYVLCNKDIAETYVISKLHMSSTIALTVLVTCILAMIFNS